MSSRFRRPPSGRSNFNQGQEHGQPVISSRVTSRASSSRGNPSPSVSSCSGSPRISFSASHRRPASATGLKNRNEQSSSRRHSSSRLSTTSSRRNSHQDMNTNHPSESGCHVSFSDRSNINTHEIIYRLRNKHADEERRKATEETLLMSEYNPFSRPRPSTAIPLRTAFLDPEVNNFYPSKTRSELLKRIKLASMPHPSYDIDGDGWVSQEDYKLAKRFDFDGNGVIDPYEKKIAKAVITDEFFKQHKENLNMFGEKIANASHDENVNAVVNSSNFERTFGLLKGVEDSLKGRASKEMLGCMDTVHKNLTKHNFFTNKFDTTAWNDYDAIPRGDQPLDEMVHNGSRRRLMEARKARSRLDGNKFTQQASFNQKTLRNHRIALISNPALEN